jgi:hypothetical protein
MQAMPTWELHAGVCASAHFVAADGVRGRLAIFDPTYMQGCAGKADLRPFEPAKLGSSQPMSKCHKQHRRIPMPVTIRLCGLDQLLNLAWRQVLAHIRAVADTNTNEHRTKSHTGSREPILVNRDCRASIDPPRSGTGSGNIPGARRNRTEHSPAVGANRNGAPMLIGKIKIEPAGMLGDAGIDRALGTIKLRAGFE